jgi:hypothetical protein
MNTRMRNDVLTRLDQSIREVVQDFAYIYNDDELFELAVSKVSAALDTLRLPDGDQHG